MSNSTNATKVTKAMRFEQIKAIVSDNAELVAFIDHELELLKKKNSSKGESKNAKANADIKANIVTLMGTDTYTIGQLTKAYNEQYGTEFSANKISALVKQLKDNAEVVRT
jgi:hypothetical protein